MGFTLARRGASPPMVLQSWAMACRGIVSGSNLGSRSLDPGTFIPEPSSIGLGAVALLTSLVWWRSATFDRVA